MIVDTSALVAILFGEPERQQMLDAIQRADAARIGAPNWLELCLVVDSRTLDPSRDVAGGLQELLGIDVVPFDENLARAARQAHRQFGRGRHPARLNFGDCMAYALAKSTGEPLLFKGDDFSQTDITPALA